MENIDLVRYASGLSEREIAQFEPVATHPDARRLFESIELRLFEPGESFSAAGGLRYALLAVGRRARILVMERPDGAWEARRSPITEPEPAAAAIAQLRALEVTEPRRCGCP